MVIEKIDIKSFGFITDMTLEFSESLNVIEGQNEAGKSTIAAFIKYMLFGFDTSDGKGLDERKKRINWTTGIAEGNMIIRVKDKRYLLSRSTVLVPDGVGRDSYKEDSSIMDMSTGVSAYGKLPAGDVFFGVTKDLFENTAFIGQLGDTTINEDSVKQSIENIIFSGSEKINIQRAKKRISDRMENLVHENQQGGVLIGLQNKSEELSAELDRYRLENKKILDTDAQLYGVRKEKSEAEEKYQKLMELDSCYSDVQLIQSFERLSEYEKSSEEKTEEYNKFIEENRHCGFVPTDDYLTEIKTARQNVNETYQNLNDCEEDYLKEKNSIGITREIEGAIEEAEKLGGEDKILSDAKTLRSGLFKNIAFLTVSMLLALAAVICEIIAKGGLATITSRVIVGILGILFLTGAVYSFTEVIHDIRRLQALASKFGVEGYVNLKGKIAVIAEARARRDSLIRSTESARLGFEKAKVDYSNAKSDLVRVITRWGGEPPMTELNDYLDGLETKVASFIERKKVLLDAKIAEDLTVKEVRKTLADYNEMEVRARISPFKRKALSTINHTDIIKGKAELKEKISALEKDISNLENKLLTLKSETGDPGEVKTKIEALQEKIDELMLKHKAYFMAKSSISMAEDNLRAGISPRLGEYATHLMGIMTDSKYSDFKIDDGLKITYTTDNNDKKSIDFMSGGTRDLAYIAVRMALIDMLYPDRPPVCFDESFAHQDNIRARSMMKALSYLAEKENQQSFVFTCRGRESVLAEELVPGAVVFKLSVLDDSID